jgi:hypothetical protein
MNHMLQWSMEASVSILFLLCSNVTLHYKLLSYLLNFQGKLVLSSFFLFFYFLIQLSSVLIKSKVLFVNIGMKFPSSLAMIINIEEFVSYKDEFFLSFEFFSYI